MKIKCPTCGGELSDCTKSTIIKKLKEVKNESCGYYDYDGNDLLLKAMGIYGLVRSYKNEHSKTCLIYQLTDRGKEAIFWSEKKE